ncbi:hypothetical protein DC3_41760 [Deinococcus cellulosilyticus NBRC 106333 = KACC 11606]|uniref:Fimbrial biogenesis outer membrane usher protein n=1 Tax=Deinococcus cellulosilyticus (strain DSM 18568 / NBRC 106333 / KACC 11606 / 5516J-15) TaxID=1223518 RepID=A0A511N7Z3_DEIC1|nr:hypothetical protein DC3_41760 [Deinococcus cellulosilyticus NBRC 106333 = KACC 11606]
MKVNGLKRDTVAVRYGPPGALVPRDLLIRPEQLNLTRVDCEGQALLLVPFDQVEYAPEEQALSLKFAVEKYPAQVLDVQDARINSSRSLTTLPVWYLDFNVSARKQQNLFSQQATVGVNVAVDQLQARLGVKEIFQNNQVSVQGQGHVHYPLSPHWMASGLWNMPRSGLSLLSGASGNLFSGVQVQGGEKPSHFLEPISLLIQHPSSVVVLVDGQVLMVKEVDPGPLKVEHVLLPNGKGTVSVVVQNAVKAERFDYPYETPADLLRPGAYQALLFAGWNESKNAPQVGATAAYGLGAGWLVEGEAVWEGQQTAEASITGLWKQDVHQFGVQLGLNHQKDAGFSPHLKSRYIFNQQPWTLTAQLDMPLSAPFTPFVQATAGLQQDAFGLQLTGQFDSARHLVSGRLQGNWNLQEGSSVYAYVSADNRQNYRVGLGGRFKLDPQITGAVEVNKAIPSGPVQAQATLVYQPDAQNTVTLAADLQQATLSHHYDGVVETDVSVSTRLDASASIQGSVTLVGDQFYLSREQQGSAILVKVGIPDIPLYVNGQLEGKTNAAGELLVLGLPSNRAITVGVNLNDLPFNITTEQESETVTLGQQGMAVLDWTSRFQVSTWVQFLILDQPVRNGTLRVGGSTYPLDDQGWGLLNAVSEAASAVLETEDGQTCNLTLASQQEQYTCEMVFDDSATVPPVEEPATTGPASHPPVAP